jgi:hypothetical protein
MKITSWAVASMVLASALEASALALAVAEG